MRQVALECGYSSASLRERIYLGTPSSPAAGVLISTAASDSEGTLGGLVALGERRYLERILRQALDDAAHCSSDPLCAEHVPEFPSRGAAQRRLPRLPVRLRDELRGRQPVAGPRGAGRPHRRRPRVPAAVSGPGGGSVRDPHDGMADWACRIAERLPTADVRRLAEAAAAGEPGVRQLRATHRLRRSCGTRATSCCERLGYAEPAYLAGLLTGAARAVERARRHQSVSVVWTGPESGVSSSRLTAAAVIELINAARSEILLVSYATHTEPSISTALSAAVGTGRSGHAAGRTPRGQPVLHGSGHALPGPRRAPPALAARRRARPARHCTRRSSWSTTRSRSSAARTSPAAPWSPTSNAASSSAVARSPAPSATTSPACTRQGSCFDCEIFENGPLLTHVSVSP